MQTVLKSYLRRLTNLSGNNRSLSLLRLISEQFIDLHEFDYALNEPSFRIIENIIARKKHIPLCQEIDPRDGTSNKLSCRLKKLVRAENFIFHERGAKDLYVGWPFIRGKFGEDTLVRCPLIFFPVQLAVEKGMWVMSPKKDVNVTFNKSFLLAYAYYNELRPDEELLDRVIDDFDADSTVFRTQLYELLRESTIDLHFNQDNYIDKLNSFKKFTKSELAQSEKTGALKMYPEAVLGIFPQSGSYLVPDYVSLLENKSIADLEEFFNKRIKENPDDEGVTRYSDRVHEENTFTPFEIDAYQEEALKMIKKGNSMCIQGPPGTGKSQLISNLICDFIARGKNVLLICQKKAALDVVYSRLKEKELHDFAGLVHDFKSDRKYIFEKIQDQIERVDEYKKKNNGLDSIHLERTYQQSSRKIEIICEELDEYKTALFDDKECGKSVKELYLSSNQQEKSIYLKQSLGTLKYPDVQEFELRLTRYLTYSSRYDNKTNFWSSGLTFANYQSGDFKNIKDTLSDALATFDQFEKESISLLHKALDYESAIFFLNKKEVLDQFTANLDNENTYRFFRRMLLQKPDKDDKWVIAKERTILQCFKGSGLETTLKQDELGRFQESLQRAIQSRRNIFSLLRWKLFSKDRVFITRVLMANELKSNREGFKILLQKIDNRLNYEHNISTIDAEEWLFDFPKTSKKLDIENWFFYQRNALKTFGQFQQLRNLDVYISFKNDHRKSQIQLLKDFSNLIDTLPVQQQIWKRYMSDKQLAELLSGVVSKTDALKELERDFDNLVDFHGLKNNFTSIEQNVADQLQQEAGTIEEKLQYFQNSLALAWIENIESKYPVLRTISTLLFDQNIKELRECVEKKRETGTEIVLLKSREKTYDDLEFNRLQNQLTYRDLLHQVSKKKRIWPLRKVITEYSEELFKLIPCWMVSPESASAIFPMAESFDLVIFDEASQCFAERGIPGMYRGKQVVIAGDEMQLKPFDLYKPRWTDEETEDPDLEVDSLLDLANRYLPKYSLEGHYRSKSLELIEFSNQHFYKGKLKLLPEKSSVNNQNSVIHYIKVDGTWEQNTNHVEAVKIIELVNQITKTSPGKSIGIVTFNAKQQELIIDLLDEQDDNWSSLDLFVKNIENVQGDERDVIIFSIAYAKDVKGKLQMKFGSLNMAGGENRLNVAVTRAREAIYVVTSIKPSELDVSKSRNDGPKLLKEYLQYSWDIANSKWQNSVQDVTQYSSNWYLKNRLVDQVNGYKGGTSANHHFQFADIMIQKDNQQLGLISTDDSQFFDARSSKQTYVYDSEILSLKNWPNMRIHSREYWRSREETEMRIDQFINRIIPE